MAGVFSSNGQAVEFNTLAALSLYILPNSKSRGTLENSVWVYINRLINITADAAFGIVSAGPCDRDVIVAYRLSKKLIVTQEFHPQYELVARVERNTFPLLEGRRECCDRRGSADHVGFDGPDMNQTG